MTSTEHPNRQPRGQAVVCGASMAGLLAARVMSELYDTVVVVERDVLPEDPSHARRTRNRPAGPGPHPLPSPRPALLAHLKERV